MPRPARASSPRSARSSPTTGGNVVEADQHSDPAAGLFLQRVEFDVDAPLDALHDGFAPIAERFAMDWSLHDLATRPRVAVLASRQGHCLADLLVRNALGELAGEFVLVASNHDTHAALVERFDVPFRHLPVADDSPTRAPTQERALGALLDETAPDVVVLAALHARAARVARRRVGPADDQHPPLVPAVVRRRAPVRAGARTRREGDRRDRALRHADLDEGPIIAQQVLPVSHRDDPNRLERRGRDLEAVVLAEALRLHLEHRVIVYGRRTAVFD